MLGILANVEEVQINHLRMFELRDRLGTDGAVDLMCLAMENLAIQLAGLHTSLRQGHLSAVHVSAVKIQTVAGHIGLVTLANVAGDVSDLATGNDGTALMAAAARLTRIGEQSLVAVWNTEDLSI